MSINDITKQLAAKFSNLSLEKKPEPEEDAHIETRSEYESRSSYISRPPQSTSTRSSLWPSERMRLDAKPKPWPKRAACTLQHFTDDELDEMFQTPARRSYQFEDWLEVIGLPRDLHEKHDGVIYNYAARNFLLRKSEAHGR